VGYFKGFVDLINQGGFTMILLVLCSITVVAVVIERLVFFGQQHADGRELLREIGGRVAIDDLPGALTICERSTGMLPRILSYGIERADKSRADITDALTIALMDNVGSLERNLAIIGTIAVIAPFVGLFGTVLGIIRAFQDIAASGNSTPAVVAAGVSEALVTTAAGLLVAVISVVAFNYFKTRIKAYNQEMIVAANSLAEMLYFHHSGQAIPTDVYTPPSAPAHGRPLRTTSTER